VETCRYVNALSLVMVTRERMFVDSYCEREAKQFAVECEQSTGGNDVWWQGSEDCSAGFASTSYDSEGNWLLTVFCCILFFFQADS